MRTLPMRQRSRAGGSRHTSAAYSDQTVDGFSLLACKTVDNRGFNLPAIPAGETDENGVPLGNDFTSDINVRRAINLAIDRMR